MEWLDWMAWTWQTAIFFVAILSALAFMTVLAIRFPEAARLGVLGVATTRGDRLFLSLLFSAAIHIVWIGFAGGAQLWVAGIASLLVAIGVFRYV